MRHLPTSRLGWSHADVAAVDDLLDALRQEREIIDTMWFVDADKEWRLPRLQPGCPPSPRKATRRGRLPSEAHMREFHIPTRWTKEQASLVHGLLCNIGTQIWRYYLAPNRSIRPGIEEQSAVSAVARKNGLLL